MANESGYSNFYNLIESLKAKETEGFSSPTIVATILKTASENECRIIELEESYYIQKGESPSALLHLNIDSPTDILFDFSSADGDKSIKCKSNINFITSAIIINYLLSNSVTSFDVLL